MGAGSSGETSCFGAVYLTLFPVVQPHQSHERYESDMEQALLASRDLYEFADASSLEARIQLQAVLERHNVEARKVIGDGNCQFRALSVVLFGDESRHAMIRQHVVAQLRLLSGRYEDFVHEPFDDYLERMARDGSWGDNVTLQAAADAFACVVRLLTDQLGSEVVEVQPMVNAEFAEPVCMTFLTERHYDAAVVGVA